MNINITLIAKNLRKKLTDTERILWTRLRAKQLEGLKFRRQEPIGEYIVDFVCYERGIIIEADGGQHSSEKEKDAVRDKWLKKEGFKVLRFWNNEILTNIEGVLEVIREECLNHPPLPPPIQGGEVRDGIPSREGKYRDDIPSREGKYRDGIPSREGKYKEMTSRQGGVA